MAVPESSPPPPSGTTNVSRSGRSSSISSATVPAPAITSRWLYADTNVAPDRRTSSTTAASAASYVGAVTISAPSRASATRFASGAVSGRWTRAFNPRWRAAVAIASPWLPAEAVVTSTTDGRSSFKRRSALAAPRILNDPVACTISSFSQISAPVASDSQGDRMSGVRHARPSIRRVAARMSSRDGATDMTE